MRRLGVLVGCLLIGLACSSGDEPTERATDTTTPATPTTTPATTAGDSSPTTTTPTTVPPIEWTSCGGDECATVAVPLDHDDPTGPTIDLAVRRLPATGDRIGPLFFDFGGPGSGTISILRSFPVPAAVRERFDLVGVDPRGVGGSTPLDCGVDPQTLYSVDHTIEDQIDIDTLVDVSRRYADDCAAEHGDLLDHVGTTDVARDLDWVRAAMGDEQLSFVGYSYGTARGAQYAQLYPDRVHTMILDGVVDTADDGIEFATEQARGF